MNRGKRAEYGVVLAAKGVIREGYTVFKGGNCIGKVTSGTNYPTLNCSIGIILVSEGLKDGDEVEVKVRDHMCRAVVTPLPFLKSGAKH